MSRAIPAAPSSPQMYQWIRPQLVMPVHGEMRHLAEHARFAIDSGVPGAVLQKDGDIIRLAPGTPQKIGEATVGRLAIDGDVILPADGSTINERRKLAAFGQISVAVAINKARRAGRRARRAPAGHPGRGGARSVHRRGDRRRARPR